VSQAPRDESAGSEAGLARAWREASHDEPPAAMDDAIRAAARKAVHAGPRPAGASPFGGRWRVPLSVAAVLVVSATVTLLVAERGKHGSRSFHDQVAPPPAASAPEPFGAAPAPAEPELPVQAAEQVAPPVPSRLRRSGGEPAGTQPRSPSARCSARLPSRIRRRRALSAPRARNERRALRNRLHSRVRPPPRLGTMRPKPLRVHRLLRRASRSGHVARGGAGRSGRAG
jgi:hypothetical protein